MKDGVVEQLVHFSHAFCLQLTQAAQVDPELVWSLSWCAMAQYAS